MYVKTSQWRTSHKRGLLSIWWICIQTYLLKQNMYVLIVLISYPVENLSVAVIDLFKTQNISKSSHGRVFVLRQDLSGIILSGHCDKNVLVLLIVLLYVLYSWWKTFKTKHRQWQRQIVCPRGETVMTGISMAESQRLWKDICK